MQDVEIFTDGAARGNPGPGGFGAILRFVDSKGESHISELSGGYALTTNNRMELLGVISALEALKRPCNVVIYTDSKYVSDAFNQNWIGNWIKRGWKTADKKPVKNVDLWKRMMDAIGESNIEFVWVKGHAGHPENERCDELATTAADSDSLLEDTGYIEQM